MVNKQDFLHDGYKAICGNEKVQKFGQVLDISGPRYDIQKWGLGLVGLGSLRTSVKEKPKDRSTFMQGGGT